ncbi:flagellin N-terminal helical domain-containing protein, partial [Endobacterium cereale]|nr:flagellin [Endobacterium cereale]
MTSIITNTAAMAALSTLRSVSADMETTQGRVSSGYKVETASDNAAYWSIATTMRSDNKSLGAVEDALGLGA